MKYPCKRKFAPTVMNRIRVGFQFQIVFSMDIHERACVAVVGASNKKITFLNTLNFSTDKILYT